MTARRRRSLKLEWNIAKDTDKYIYERLMQLKDERNMLPTIRKALLLYFTLQDGELDVLQEEFPELIEYLMAEGARDERTKQTINLEGKIIDLQEMMKKIGQQPRASPALAGPKQMKVQTFALPEIDDDDDLEITKSAASTTAAQNLANAALGLINHTKK